jgi:hypothetical protein
VWRRQARMIPGGAVHEGDGVVVALTNLPDPSLNVAMVERQPEDPGSALAAAEAWFQRYGFRLGLELERGRYSEVETAALARGLRPVTTRPGMARGIDGFRPIPPPSGVSIERVRDRAALGGVVDIQVEAFSWVRRIAKRFLPASVLEVPGLRLYLATLDGLPAASAVAHLDDGAVGIFGVGTVLWARRRGIATAITGRVMADADGEADLAWLIATPEGRSVYERMGFRPAGQWSVWVG